MSEWPSVPLGEVLSLIRNGTVAEQHSDVTSFPVTRIESISEGKVDWKRVGYLRFPDAGYLLQRGDILYSHINSVKHMGKVAIYDDPRPLYHGMNLMLLRPAQDKVNPYFLYYQLTSERGRGHARRECRTAINQSSLTQRDIIKFPVFLPSIIVQESIAEILATVDEAIEQTEALIAKTQQIKAGMMHDLFTRGVTRDGQLRPPREEAPHLYKKSSLGWIPKDWDVHPCSAVTEFITVGIVIRPAQYYVSSGVPALRSANVSEDGINAADLVYISSVANAQLSKSQLCTGDVISVRTGYPAMPLT